MTDTVSGAALGSFVQTVNALPALIPVSAPGYVTRQIAVSSALPLTVDLIPEAAPFDLGFYRQLARNGLEAPDAMQPLRVLAASPSIYIQTTGLSAAAVSALEQAARAVVPAFSGGRLSVAGWETGDALRPDARNWITVEIINEAAGTQCGRASVGAVAGHVWLNVTSRCLPDRNLPTAFSHELGHALGFWHVATSDALMFSTATLGRTLPSSAERYHAGIAYHRSAGNRDVDADVLTSGLSAPRMVID